MKSPRRDHGGAPNPHDHEGSMADEVDLSTLATPELIDRMQDDLYDGLAPEVGAGTKELLARGLAPYEVLTQALVAGMDVVGADFRDGILFVPEVLMAAKAMKAGMEILRPLLAETGAPQIGTMVIGTVKGDIHDIGKNLVAMMMEGAGFKVVNLGINVDAEKFLAAIDEHKPDILGMSALLTTTMPYMGVVIKSLKDVGIREKLIVLVGGAPLNAAFAEEIEADAYCRDAAVAVETAKKLVAIRRRQAV
jgi:5-methyltetrahydrofolate--homocysteine methyltransferase